jgi:hypothetical protein
MRRTLAPAVLLVLVLALLAAVISASAGAAACTDEFKATTTSEW